MKIKKNKSQAMTRIRTVEKDPRGGWIARDPFDGHVILGDDFRWNSRECARTVVWEARNLSEVGKMSSP